MQTAVSPLAWFRETNVSANQVGAETGFANGTTRTRDRVAMKNEDWGPARAELQRRATRPTRLFRATVP